MITLSLLHPLNKKPVQNWSFDQDQTIRIGRSTENDVVLYSAVVSRHHVELRQTDSGWEIVNLGTNGTYLDGKRVSQAPAVDGVVIRLARSGPNIQINIGQQDDKNSMDALRKLSQDAAARNKPFEHQADSLQSTDIQPPSDLKSPDEISHTIIEGN